MAPPLNPGGLGALAKESKARRCAAGMFLALLLWLFTGGGLLYLAGLTPGAGPAHGGVPDAGGGFEAAAAAGLPAALVPTAIGFAAAAILLCPLTAFFYARLYRRSIGGYTGDALGAAVETAEILHLAAILIVLHITSA
jgi:adenosylcobinamide-GDP ribazoletransferase